MNRPKRKQENAYVDIGLLHFDWIAFSRWKIRNNILSQLVLRWTISELLDGKLKLFCIFIYWLGIFSAKLLLCKLIYFIANEIGIHATVNTEIWWWYNGKMRKIDISKKKYHVITICILMLGGSLLPSVRGRENLVWLHIPASWHPPPTTSPLLLHVFICHCATIIVLANSSTIRRLRRDFFPTE